MECFEFSCSLVRVIVGFGGSFDIFGGKKNPLKLLVMYVNYRMLEGLPIKVRKVTQFGLYVGLK